MKGRWWPIILALVHTLVLACYAFPAEIIPERLRFWSTTYTRPLFHQQWNLFAPDVPPCGCTLVLESDGEYVDLMEGEGLIGRRLVKWGCRSMSNYREVEGSDENFKAWKGYSQFLERLTQERDRESMVRRNCWNGQQRVEYFDRPTE